MSDIPVSVCVVSWHRPEALKRCLLGVSQLQYFNFEIVVVADKDTLVALADWPHIKTVLATQANISKARNLGIAHCGGDVVAFIDDDRNGISWQWQGRRVNRLGQTQDHQPGAALPEGWALKTEGTNMAVRRSALVRIGGFDEGYKFFLDETDVNIRLAQAGYASALAPHAEVHHGYLPSRRRRSDRVPLSLFDIGASWARFLSRHASLPEIEPRIAEVITSEDARLLRHLVSGGLEPGDVRRLRLDLLRGIESGRAAERFEGPDIFRKLPDFSPFPSKIRPSVVMDCRPTTLRKQRELAEIRVSEGEIVTLFNLSRSSLYHYQNFTMMGVWEHHGGLFGKSERSQPLLCVWSRQDRVNAETDRVANARKITK